MVFLLAFLFVLLLVLAMTVPLRRSHQKTVSDAVNHDPDLQNFVYRVPFPAAEVLPRLCTRMAGDELRCVSSPDGTRLTFSEYGSSLDYAVTLREEDGSCLVRLSAVRRWWSSQIPLKLNAFFIAKLRAEIIPYFEDRE